MTDRFDDRENVDEQDEALAALLSPSAVWAEADSSTEDAIVAAVAAERAAEISTVTSKIAASGGVQQGPLAEVIPIGRFRKNVGAFIAGAAAAAVLLAGVFAITQLDIGSDASGVELALDATDLAPDATATATISERPDGTKILLNVVGLPPAAAGTYYEAWLRIDGDTGVSAGTFHLRGGGDTEIELWSGVSTDDFPLFTITIQDEAQEDSSGVVVLKGLITDAK